MKPRTSQPEPQPGHLTWQYVLDLRAMRPTEQANVASGLTTADHLRGQQVTVRVGALHPYANPIDPRVASFLADALRSGISLHFEGVPGPVQNWLQTLRDLSRPPEPSAPTPARGRLRVVTP